MKAVSIKSLLSRILESCDNQLSLTIVTGSATTNAQGALALNVQPSDKVMWVHILSGDSNAMAIPFRYSNSAGYWYAKVVDWRNFSIFANKTFTYEICLIE